MPIHRKLEQEVARFLKKEDAIVIGMGFATNSTILPALLGGSGGNCKGVLVISDKLNHKSIVEGVRLSGGSVKAFPHNDMIVLEDLLRNAAVKGQSDGTPWRKVFILIEGIYSMEGEFCRLREIVTLKNKYKAYLYLDEAHSIGAVGATGRGVTELFGVPTSEVEVMMGTFTKSFGSAGGYISASKAVIDGLRQSAPGSTFASAMSAPCAAQALTAFRLIDGTIGGSVGADKLASIRNNANFFRQRLIEEGFTVLGDVDSPVIPVMIYHPIKLKNFSRRCLARGIAVVVVGFPAVPVLESRARFCVSAAHTRQQLEDAVVQLAAVGREVGILYERSTMRDFVGCAAGATAPRAMKSVEQARTYAAWLRGAPMQTQGLGDVAPEVTEWTPEPLVPTVAPEISKQLGGLSAAALASTQAVGQRGALDMRLFDALGYAADPLPEASEAIAAAMEVYGFGACGPRGFYGTSKLHLELEDYVAEFLGTEDAIMYSAGVATASSVVPALVQPGDHVIIDTEVHLGLRSGLRLCKDAVVSWITHCSIEDLKAALVKAAESREARKKNKKAPGRVFIVMEAIYQRTGRLAPLAEVLDLKEKYGAQLILDETLSFGTLGLNGRGIVEHLALDGSRIDALIGSFEHAIAGVGGFCAGRRSIVEHQRLSGAGYCFSAASPPSACAAIKAMVANLSGDSGRSRIAKAQAMSSILHQRLTEVVAKSGAPVELVSSSTSYVQHLRWTGPAERGVGALLAVAGRCATSHGVQVQVCSPTLTATETSINNRVGAASVAMPSIRLCASASKTENDIATTCDVLASAFSRIMEVDV